MRALPSLPYGDTVRRASDISWGEAELAQLPSVSHNSIVQWHPLLASYQRIERICGFFKWELCLSFDSLDSALYKQHEP